MGINTFIKESRVKAPSMIKNSILHVLIQYGCEKQSDGFTKEVLS